jgi:hypothetical protein
MVRLQRSKIGNHFRRATGNIDSRNIRLGQPIDDAIDRFARHDFLPVRSGVHVAMHAGEIAELAHIDLKNFWTNTTERDRMLGKFLGKPIHPLRN